MGWCPSEGGLTQLSHVVYMHNGLKYLGIFCILDKSRTKAIWCCGKWFGCWVCPLSDSIGGYLPPVASSSSRQAPGNWELTLAVQKKW